MVVAQDSHSDVSGMATPSHSPIPSSHEDETQNGDNTMSQAKNNQSLTTTEHQHETTTIITNNMSEHNHTTVSRHSHLQLTTIIEQCDGSDAGGDRNVEPASNYTKGNPSHGDQLPVAHIIHYTTDQLDDNNQAIANLQKQIEEHNLALLGEGDGLNTDSSVKMSLAAKNCIGGGGDGTAAVSPSVSDSESIGLPSEERLTTAKIAGDDDRRDGFGEEPSKVNANTVQSSPSKVLKRIETSRSVSKQSVDRLSFFRRKFKSLTFKRRGSLFLSSQFSNNNPQYTNKIEGSYKKTSAQAIVAAIQLGIAYSVGKFSAKPDRDVLLQDFFQVEEVHFPSCGTSFTPSHRFADFTMSDYSPVAFRYFRDIFSISPENFMTSLSTRPLRQLSNPGASGSMFFVSEDDIFIIKTVDKREAKFLQQLLPGYYMNLHQNPKTLLPKFFGLYSYKYSGRNIRLVVMNNLLPSRLQFHEKYDLKGSTFKRKASQKERSKHLPTLKDLDFIENHPDGLELSVENHERLLKTLQRDIRVLQSYKIMDYSLLLCVHNKAMYEKYKLEHYRRLQANLTKSTDITVEGPSNPTSNVVDDENTNQNNPSIQTLNGDPATDDTFDIDEFLKNGIPAKNSLGEDLILFVGVIDILQNYRLIKRTEHNLKAMVHDRDSISVHNPVFYAERFISFCAKVFRVTPNQPASNENIPERKSTAKSPQKRNKNPVSSASQPIINAPNAPDSDEHISHPPSNVNKFVDNI